jgi:hypothetical protein
MGAASAKLTRVMSGDSSKRELAEEGKGKEREKPVEEEEGTVAELEVRKAVGSAATPKVILGAVKDDWPLYRQVPHPADFEEAFD